MFVCSIQPGGNAAMPAFACRQIDLATHTTLYSYICLDHTDRHTSTPLHTYTHAHTHTLMCRWGDLLHVFKRVCHVWAVICHTLLNKEGGFLWAINQQLAEARIIMLNPLNSTIKNLSGALYSLCVFWTHAPMCMCVCVCVCVHCQNKMQITSICNAYTSTKQRPIVA